VLGALAGFVSNASVAQTSQTLPWSAQNSCCEPDWDSNRENSKLLFLNKSGMGYRGPRISTASGLFRGPLIRNPFGGNRLRIKVSTYLATYLL
jgi:hypothetical protein